MAQNSVSYQALVIKRSSFGEADRVVTLLSEEKGKQSVVAKGSLAITSSRLAALEPGTLIQAYLIQTKGLPLLTQAVVTDQLSYDTQTIGQIRAITQWLELLDVLFVEEPLESPVYEHILVGRKMASSVNTSVDAMRKHIFSLLEMLGFADSSSYYNQSVSEIVSSIQDKPLRGYDYLRVE